MTDVAVRAVGPREVEVTTTSGPGRTPPSQTTVHRVTVDDAVLRALDWTDPAPSDLERLVAASFAFLLDREPATAVLGRFELSVIETYFPGYLRDIRTRVG